MKTLHEICQEISTAVEFEKVEVLNKHKNNTRFKKFLSIVFDPRITWDLPSGVPPYKRDETIPPDYAYTNLGVELRTMYVYFSPSPLHNKVKRESRFIELLENLHYTEADLLCNVKDGRFLHVYPGITIKFLLENWPDVFYMDGIFQTSGEWAICKTLTKRNNVLVESYDMYKKSDIINGNVRLGSYCVNVITNEVYKEDTENLMESLEIVTNSVSIEDNDEVKDNLGNVLDKPVQDVNGGIKFIIERIEREEPLHKLANDTFKNDANGVEEVKKRGRPKKTETVPKLTRKLGLPSTAKVKPKAKLKSDE